MQILQKRGLGENTKITNNETSKEDYWINQWSIQNFL
jgi:hypothetical protein